MRHDPEQQDQLLAAFALRRRLRIEHAEVDYAAVVKLAADTRLTAYDASYLWLSREAGVELITLDRRLAAAAGHPGP